MKYDIKNLVNIISNQLLPIYENKSKANNIAWWIINWLTSYSQSELILKKEIELNESQKLKLDNAIKQHVIEKKPLQYIFGDVPFLNLKINVKPPILIPRPETEEWCSYLIDFLKKLPKDDFKILDLCTGSGCIALAFAKEFKNSTVYAIDISDQACQLTEENAKKNNIENIIVLQSDLYSALPKKEKFDLIVSNPPYISLNQWNQLDPMVSKWEDFQALVAEEEGLEIIKKIIQDAKKWLKFNPDFLKAQIPQIAIEIDRLQGQKVKQILENCNFVNVNIKKDLYKNDRLAIAGIASEHSF